MHKLSRRSVSAMARGAYHRSLAPAASRPQDLVVECNPNQTELPSRWYSALTASMQNAYGLANHSRMGYGLLVGNRHESTAATTATTDPSVEKFEYQAEVTRLMDLIVHSLYSNKEVFLRELISNASDALDKLRFLSVTEPELLKEAVDLDIRIQTDQENGIISITDTGIGMTRQELVDCLGTIAQSGTAKFLKALKDSKDAGSDNNLIGQFGVGFYSAFLVSDKVTVSTKSPKSDKQYVWEGEANASSYVIREETNPEKLLPRGTRLTLYLKRDDKGFAHPERIQNLVKNYSQFVSFPIYTWQDKGITKEMCLEQMQLIENLERISDPKRQRNPRFQSLAPRLSPQQITQVIESNPNPISAFNFFIRISQAESHKHLIESYFVLLKKLVGHRMFGHADHVRILLIKACGNEEELSRSMAFLEGISVDSFRFTIFTYNTLLIQLGKFNMVESAQNVYEQMMSYGVIPSLLTFNAMINILCKNGRVQDAELIVSRMFQYGFRPDVFTYTSLILGHCKNYDLDSAFQIFGRMVKEGCTPNSVTYGILINALCNEGQLDEALGIFKEMVEKGVEPTVYTYTVPVTSLCKCGRIKDAWNLVVDMRKRGCCPNVQTYTGLISGLFCADQFKTSVGLFHKMLRDGLVPNIVTYNALINGLCSHKKIELALKVFNQMGRRGCFPNVESYNEMIKGFCVVGKIEKAMVLFNQMLKTGPQPNEVTYNTLIDGYCNCGNLRNAMRLFDFMKENGCKPDEWTFTELICGFCKVSKLESALEIFGEMGEHGLSANEVTYTALIDGHCKLGEVDGALSLLEKMEETGNEPNVQTYNVIINGLCKENRLTEAVKLLEKLIEQGLLPNVVTYSTLIDALCKNGDTHLALKIFDEMGKQDCAPNLQTYSMLVYGLCQAGKAEEAEALTGEMESKGLVLDEVTYTSLIDGYVMLDMLDRAFMLLRQMVNGGCQPNYRTFGVLMKGMQKECHSFEEKHAGSNESTYTYGLSGKDVNFDVVSSLLVRLSEIGCDPTISTYNILVCGLCREGRTSEAERLVRSMIEKGMSPDEETSNCLVVTFCKQLRVDAAMDIFNEMISRGLEPHLVTYKTLISALCNARMIDKAEAVFGSLLSHQWNPDEVVWTVLIDGLLSEGESALCMHFLHSMEAKNISLSFQTYVILMRELSKDSLSVDLDWLADKLRV